MTENHLEITLLGTKERLEASRKICRQLMHELAQIRGKYSKVQHKKKRGDRHDQG